MADSKYNFRFASRKTICFGYNLPPCLASYLFYTYRSWDVSSGYDPEEVLNINTESGKTVKHRTGEVV